MKGTKEYHEMPEKLYKNIQYTKAMLLTGFLKSTVGTTFISLGSTVAVYSYIQPQNYLRDGCFIGIILVLLGLIIYALGDVYKMRNKKQELKLIDKHIKDKANEIAEKMVEKKLKEIEDELCD